MKFDLSKDMDIIQYNSRSEYLLKKGKKVELKEIRESRTINQNSYLHVCISMYAIEYGYTISEAKTNLKRACSFMVYEKDGIKYLVETSKQNTEELTRFIEWIRNYTQSNGLYIPSAEEYKENKFNIDREIDKYKEFL